MEMIDGKRKQKITAMKRLISKHKQNIEETAEG